MANPFNEFAYYVGRVLLAAFVAWYSINPHITQNQGHEFALFVSKHFKDVYLKNETILSALDLTNPVDPTTLFQSIFYGSLSSKYYKIQNLAAETTYVQLFDEKGEVNCDYHPISCSIYEDLSILKKDFPITRDLFDAQWNSNYYLIDEKIYKDVQNPKAKKVIIKKNLEIKDYPDYKSYGFSKMGSDVHIVSASTNFSITSITQQPLYSQQTNLGPEDWQTFPYYQEDPESQFYPYNTDVYDVSSRVNVSGSYYELGDKWFNNEEQLEREGYSKEYNGMWIYGLLNEGNIAENLTEFTTCLLNSSYIDCVHEYLLWYQDCPTKSSPNDKRICSFINRNLQKIQKRIQTKAFLKNQTPSLKKQEPSKQLITNTYIMIGLGALCIVICIVGIIILKERNDGISIISDLGNKEKREQLIKEDNNNKDKYNFLNFLNSFNLYQENNIQNIQSNKTTILDKNFQINYDDSGNPTIFDYDKLPQKVYINEIKDKEKKYRVNAWRDGEITEDDE